MDALVARKTRFAGSGLSSHLRKLSSGEIKMRHWQHQLRRHEGRHRRWPAETRHGRGHRREASAQAVSMDQAGARKCSSHAATFTALIVSGDGRAEPAPLILLVRERKSPVRPILCGHSGIGEKCFDDRRSDLQIVRISRLAIRGRAVSGSTRCLLLTGSLKQCESKIFNLSP